MSDRIITGAKKVFEQAQEILDQRAKVYDGVQCEDYFPYGLVSYAQMVHLKAMRLQSGVLKSELAGPVDDEWARSMESMKDSLLDLINYAAFMAVVVDDALEFCGNNGDTE